MLQRIRQSGYSNKLSEPYNFAPPHLKRVYLFEVKHLWLVVKYVIFCLKCQGSASVIRVKNPPGVLAHRAKTPGRSIANDFFYALINLSGAQYLREHCDYLRNNTSDQEPDNKNNNPDRSVKPLYKKILEGKDQTA